MVVANSKKDRVIKIKVRSVSLTYQVGDRTIHVLDNINLNIYDREFLCVVGPSGCGKTSLLRIMAGLIEPSEGHVIVDGKTIKEPGAERAVVFQTDAVFPWMNVEQNIGYGPRVARKPYMETKRIVEQFLEFTELKGFEKAWPKELSGGMRKRVDLARAFANNPEVLLMDEPFGSLDVITKERIQIELQKLYEVKPKTIFFVTHDLEEALFVGHRVIVMSARPGRIVADLEIPLPYPRPLTVKTEAEFIKLRRKLNSLLSPQG